MCMLNSSSTRRQKSAIAQDRACAENIPLNTSQRPLRLCVQNVNAACQNNADPEMTSRIDLHPWYIFLLGNHALDILHNSILDDCVVEVGNLATECSRKFCEAPVDWHGQWEHLSDQQRFRTQILPCEKPLFSHSYSSLRKVPFFRIRIL